MRWKLEICAADDEFMPSVKIRVLLELLFDGVMTAKQYQAGALCDGGGPTLHQHHEIHLSDIEMRLQ